MDTIVDQYQWDDRGTAFSTWRKLLQQMKKNGLLLNYVMLSLLLKWILKDHQTSIESRLDFIIHLGPILFIL